MPVISWIPKCVINQNAVNRILPDEKRIILQPLDANFTQRISRFPFNLDLQEKMTASMDIE